MTPLIVQTPSREWARLHIASLLREGIEVLAGEMDGDRERAAYQLAVAAKRHYERVKAHRSEGA